MLAFRQAGFGTGGSHCFVDHFGVAQGIHCHRLTAQFFSANRAVYHIVIAAGVHTVGSNFVLLNCFAIGVAQCIDNSLCNQNLVTYGAMLAFRQAGFGTGGSHCFVDHFGVALSGCFSSDIAVLASGAGIGGVATLGTGGLGYYSTMAMAELRNCCLRSQNFVTYGAVLAFRQTGCSTGGSNCFVDHFGVAQCIDNSLCNQNLVTYGAMLAFCQTSVGTIGCNGFVDHFSMTQCVYSFLCHQRLAAAITVLAFRQTGFGTGRCNCFVGHFFMAQCVYNFLCLQSHTANGTLHTRGKTGFGTGCRYSRDRLIGVALSTNYKRCCHGLGFSCFILEEEATFFTAALVMFFVSVFGTGRCLSLHLFKFMTQRINLLCVGMSRIVSTGKGHYTLCCTGRLSGNHAIIVIMSGPLSDHNGGFLFTGLICKDTLTVAAGVVCVVTICCTGCFLSFGQGHIMTTGRNLAISGVIALSAMLICFPTDFRTGCCLGSYCCNIMAFRSDGHLLNSGFIYTGFILKYLVTCRTCIVLIVAGLCTGCCLGIGLGHGVTKRCLFNIRCVVASRAGYICIPADLRTGRCLCFVSNFIVTQCVYSFLCLQSLTANGALHAFSKTGFRTGCRHFRDGLVGVTLSRNHFIRSLFNCPRNNKGCRIGFLTSFGTSSFCCYCALYCCCCRFKIAAVAVDAHTLSGAVSITIGPFIGCLIIFMAQYSNIFFVLRLVKCPIDIKGCRVGCPALFGTGCCSLNRAGDFCRCSLNMAVVIVADMLSGADPDTIGSVILPFITCVCIVMIECFAYSNSLIRAYHITTVTLYIVSCRICTSSIRCYVFRILISETMTQLGVIFFQCLGIMNSSAAITLCIVPSIFCTSCSLRQLFREQCITMIQSLYFVTHIAVTAITGVCGIAALGTGRIGYNTGVHMLMRIRCNFDSIILGNIVNVDIDHLTAELGILDLTQAFSRNILAISQNGYLHDKGGILKLQVCIEVFTRHNGTGCTFHSGYALNIVGNIYMILCKESAVVANCRFKRVCKNLHTLDIGMQPVFHQILVVCFICFDTGVFNISHMQSKVSCHLPQICIKLSGLMDARSKGKHSHHIDLRVGISLLHLMEGDGISLHGIYRLCISKGAVSIIGDQCSKVYIFIASQHRLIIGTVLDLCIGSIDQFCVLKVIGAHVNNDDIGFLTAVCSGVIMELHNTVFVHTGCIVLPEMNSTAGPGVIYEDIRT